MRPWASRLSLNRFNRMASTTSTAPGATIGPYNHLEVEAKWQRYWDDNSTFVSKRRPGHPKKYVLDMFPYPSGAGLHVGHPEGYTATDIMARYWRMKDFDVLHPMGWDAFGLPAEQHAISTGTHPAATTLRNIATFKRQLKALGFSYDWTRELSTTDAEYVRWTQWLFLRLFSAGLAAQSQVSVNWCPALGTVLANEEVINGLSERGGHPVVRQPLRQWVLRLPAYAAQLDEGLSDLDWPEGTLSSQRQWIGRSQGATVRFPVLGGGEEVVEVFTTRPDTLMGATYVVLAPEHPLVAQLTTPDRREAVAAYQKAAASKTDLERTGTGTALAKTGERLGACVAHPLTSQPLPVFIADYVLASYGTGAVMAVPAHDERDFAFAAALGLQLQQVIATPEEVQLPYCGEGTLVNSGALDGLSSEEARVRVLALLRECGRGGATECSRLRDWVFSRQRYWGEPIPIYFPVEMLAPGSPADGAAHVIRYDLPRAVDETELPLALPPMEHFLPGDDPQGCLARATDWRFFQRDGNWYARETNTMPQWAGSCWYYLRFTDPHNANRLFGEEGASWLPVDLYVGGQEHAVLHLLYARFWHKVLYDLRIVDHAEPFSKVVHQGMILGSDGEKMSKSRGNVINPDEVVAEHGADALRLYEMFMGPLEAVKPWQTQQLMGVVRFRDRVFNLLRRPRTDDAPAGEVLQEMHRTVRKVSGDIERMSFNTAISALMIYSNLLAAQPAVPRQALEALVLLLSPFAPHVAEECWALLGHERTLAYEPWPAFREEVCEGVQDSATLVVSVNGKVRRKLTVPRDMDEADARELAMQACSRFLPQGAEAQSDIKVVYKANKMLNLVF